MGIIKAIETQYNGYLFRSRLEARWAVFFDACGVDYEYEPQGYDLGDGLFYLPDFLLHDVKGRIGGDLYIEVKGVMSDKDAIKINRFAASGLRNIFKGKLSESPILVVGKIPAGDNMCDILNYISNTAYTDNKNYPNEFNFATIDGNYFAAYPGINKGGNFEIFGDDADYLADMDEFMTEKAYRLARNARFEFGQVPHINHTYKHLAAK